MPTPDEPSDDETPKVENPPPTNKLLMDMASLAIRIHEEERQAAFNASRTAMDTRGSSPWLLAPGPLPEDHPFYALVGRVASEWAHLEHIIDLTIWKLLDVDDRLGACLTAQYPGVGQRCEAVCSLGTVRGLTDEQVKPFRQLKQAAFPTADWRARWIHDPWFVQEGAKPAQFRAMPRVDRQFGLKEISEEDMKKTIGIIKGLQDEARLAEKIVLDALATLLEKQV